MEFEHIGDLHLGGGTHVTAASGLVRHEGRLFVVSDDDCSMAMFPEDLSAPGETLVLLDEHLPEEHHARKAAKPDLESLALMPDGSLLALGSGSTERRQRGFRVRGRDVEVIDLSALYGQLRRELADLNIEGCAVANERIWLAQRGNGADGWDAIVECDMHLRLVGIHGYGLPDGLNFTDLSPLGGSRVAFAAACEASASTYDDGEVTGVAIGVLDVGLHEVLELHPLPVTEKVEGIAPQGDGAYLLVADPDDASQPAPLFRSRPR